MLKFANSGQFIDQIDLWEAQVYEQARQAAMGLAAYTFKNILMFSAQYSGDFAANWNLSFDEPDYSFTPQGLGNKDGERLMGNPEAIKISRDKLNRALPLTKLGDSIYFTNASKHKNDAYAVKIENDEIPFRDGNEGAPVARSMALTKGKYGGIVTDLDIKKLTEMRFV